jgi:large subunit ribosomal protein L10
MPNQLNLLIEKELSQVIRPGKDCVVVGFAKLTGLETTELRKNLRDRKIRMEVVKNSIATRVFAKAGVVNVESILQGPVAVVVGEVEMPDLCRISLECAKKYEERFVVRGGVLAGNVVGKAGVSELALIPARPVLYSRMIGSVQSPLTAVAAAFQSIPRSLACALEGIPKQKETAAASPAA